MELGNLFDNLGLGISVAVSFKNLFWCLCGAIIGTAIGVLPGVGPLATLALLLPVTYHLSPEGALIMLAGIYYGAQYGGSTTAVLVNLPGESSSVVTCIDGYQMARQGRAGPALAIAAIGSFFAGCVATIIIALAAPPLTKVAQQFAAADYFSLMVLGLVFAIVLARGSIIKAVGMIFLGMLLGLVGTDVNTGNTRFTFNISSLFDGIGFVPLAMGVFGIAEIIHNLTNTERRDLVSAKVSGLMPTREDIKQSIGPILRGTALGSFLGLLPGGGAVLSSFSAYTLEKKISRTPERFGKGAIEGVAAPEAANNAAAQTSFIPMLTLGIPSNPVMALMIGGMMIHGIIPGPQVMEQRPGLVWGLIVSMWLGNLMLVVLNLPLIGIWVRMLLVPYRLLAVAILFFCCIGTYSLNNAAEEVLLISFFGLLGYLLMKLECEPAPLLLGFILGPLMEVYMRRAMLLSRGDASIALALCAAVPAVTQNTWVVAPTLGPGVHFTTIDAALVAASPGDTILVSPGTFAGFTTSKALRIQGQGAVINSTVVIHSIPEDAAFELSSFAISTTLITTGVRVVNCAGVVLIDHVSAAGPWPAPAIPGVEAVDSGKVIVRSSILMGSTFTNSTAVFENCTIHANEVLTPHTPAIIAQGSEVLLVASRAQRFAPAQIVQLTNSELFVGRDSQLSILVGLPTGGPAVNGTGTVRVSPAASILPAGGIAYGPNIVSVTQTLDPLLVEQQTVTVRHGAGDLVAILVGLPGPTHDVPWLSGVSWFDPTGPLITMSLGVATGTATQTTLPYTPGAFPGLPLVWLALTGNATAGLAITNPNGMVLH